MARGLAVLMYPRFYCEEGSIYFVHAWHHSAIETLTFAGQGYYSVLENIGALLASRMVPLEHAPLMSTLLGTAVQLVPFAVILGSRSGFWMLPYQKLAGCILILVSQVSDEVWMTLLCVKFHMCLAAALVLLEESGTVSRRHAFLCLLVLVVAGLSSPVSAFIVPFFLFKLWKERSRWAAVWAAAACATAAVQAVLLLMFPSGIEQRFQHPSLFELLGILVAKWFLNPVFGIRIASEVSINGLLPLHLSGSAGFEWMALGSAGVVLVLIAVCWLKAPGNLGWQLLAPSFCLALLSTLTAIMAESRFRLMEPLLHTRYYFAPGALLLLFLLGAARRTGPNLKPSHLAVILVCVAALSGIWSFKLLRVRDPLHPTWKEECAIWRQDPGYMLHGWPQDWTLKLESRP